MEDLQKEEPKGEGQSWEHGWLSRAEEKLMA